jgi:hypothetical protein
MSNGMRNVIVSIAEIVSSMAVIQSKNSGKCRAIVTAALLAGSASGAVVFSQLFWPAALQQLTALLANGSWVPMATVHFAAMTKHYSPDV